MDGMFFLPGWKNAWASSCTAVQYCSYASRWPQKSLDIKVIHFTGNNNAYMLWIHTQPINTLFWQKCHKVFQKDIDCSWLVMDEKKSKLKDNYAIAYLWGNSNYNKLNEDDKNVVTCHRYIPVEHKFLNSKTFCPVNRISSTCSAQKILKMKCLTCISCQKFWRWSVWHAYPVKKQWSSYAEVVKEISLLDGRWHRIIRRCHSAESEIQTSSSFNDELEKK
jgi:hypothetical protein